MVKIEKIEILPHLPIKISHKNEKNYSPKGHKIDKIDDFIKIDQNLRPFQKRPILGIF